ncbi:MAG: DMT family transporter [Leptolyngbyaceae cyanobacterium RU_5_1]|nr:DMT family transporter [Leptolyngbyaceae cyanobacterium RU_5_1]
MQGELAALGAALIWAIAAVIYTGVGRQLSPLVLNLAKGLIAIALLILTLLPLGTLLPPAEPKTLVLLLFSGAIGIGLGDTAYFEALNCLGPRRTLVLESLAPPLAALLALIFLQERLTTIAWFGILLTVFGVTWVILERSADTPEPQSRPLRGFGFGLLAAATQASGAVMSRAALAGTDVDPLWSTFVRLIGGMVMLLLWLVVQRQPARSLKPLQSWRLLTVIAGTAFASTYLGIWLQQVSLKYAPTGVAQSLSATSPLFVLPIAIAIGDRVSVRAVLGGLVAIGGIWLLFGR